MRYHPRLSGIFYMPAYIFFRHRLPCSGPALLCALLTSWRTFTPPGSPPPTVPSRQVTPHRSPPPAKPFTSVPTPPSATDSSSKPARPLRPRPPSASAKATSSPSRVITLPWAHSYLSGLTLQVWENSAWLTVTSGNFDDYLNETLDGTYTRIAVGAIPPNPPPSPHWPDSPRLDWSPPVAVVTAELNQPLIVFDNQNHINFLPPIKKIKRKTIIMKLLNINFLLASFGVMFFANISMAQSRTGEFTNPNGWSKGQTSPGFALHGIDVNMKVQGFCNNEK
jgi:hypothetical protein